MTPNPLVFLVGVDNSLLDNTLTGRRSHMAADATP
jgi:hypothetical protein